MRQDLWALQGHGQCDPLQTPVQVLVEKSHATSYGNIIEKSYATSYYYIVCFLRYGRTISYNSDEAYDMYVRYRIIATRNGISYTTSYFFIRYRMRRRIKKWQEPVQKNTISYILYDIVYDIVNLYTISYI